MKPIFLRFTPLFLSFALTACDDPGPTSDASVDGGGCGCDDSLFCNGLERCVEGTCEPGADPCGVGSTCDEEADRCVTDCDVDADADRDGFDSRDCGGTDCDDSDPSRYPGSPEICDAAGVDEDCDPSTFGDRDEDGDGYQDMACCNGTVCGDDCDDAEASVHPDEAETCNGADEDCDGSVDEGVSVTYVIDEDRDGHGSTDPAAPTAMGCKPPAGYAESVDDCDDSVGSVHPGAYDRCDEGLVDDDCSGTPNDPPGTCECADGQARGCPLPGVCGRGTQTCVAGTWAQCSILPSAEICDNGADEDCDGAADDGCECAAEFRFCGTDEGQCGRGIQICASDGSWGPCVGADEPDPETCNMLDDDCDGTIDEGVFFRCFEDTDGDGYSVPAAATMALCASGCPTGYTDRDPTDVANRDCAPTDARAHPGQTQSFGTARTDGGGFDFDCDGTATPTDEVIGTCLENSDGTCFGVTSGITARTLCGGSVTYIACGTINNGSSGFTCEQVFSCTPSSTACGDRNRAYCR